MDKIFEYLVFSVACLPFYSIIDLLLSRSASIFRFFEFDLFFGLRWIMHAIRSVYMTKLVAFDGEGSDRFGSAVAIYGDFVAVGSPYDDVYQGSVYMYHRLGDA